MLRSLVGSEMCIRDRNYTTLDAVGGAYENAANNFFSGNVAMICNLSLIHI